MRRFATLDALRGIAAIVVMIGHTIDHPIAIPGYAEAVDLFFGLSGFVIALNYEERLRRGLSIGRFMALRVARLWPMVLLGSTPAVVLGGAWIGTLALLPDPAAPLGVYPGNPPLWSLAAEMVAYLAFALVGPRVGVRSLMATMGVCAIVMLTSPVWFDEHLARVGYSFACGVLLYRLRVAQGMPSVATGHAWWLVAAVPAFLLVRSPLVALVAFPCLLFLATRMEVGNTALAGRLGGLSYPLYCSHVGLLGTATVLGVPPVAAWPAIVGLSLVLDRWWDRPMRRALREAAEGNWKLHASAE
jgi:peptidoglycan/LPS O-acetylase OafA/YrhL